jgi:phosphoribosyl 1,2-cyclic phosphate phosphodiesterase
MKVEILGSGGATPTPRPGCGCAACVGARELGGRHARTGPSTFVHGPNVLFDTPEESRLQLARAGIGEIGACFYSHWHPDHTLGRRVWETRNVDFRGWPPEAKRTKTTDVYVPERVAEDMRRFLGHWEHLEFMESQGWVHLYIVEDGEVVAVGGVEVRPFRLAEEFVCAFELRGDGKRLLVAPDELFGWRPPAEVRGVDLAVLPMGIAEHHPLTGERLIHPEHPMLAAEATFEETLGIVDELGAERVVLTHIEEMDGLTVAELDELERRLRGEGRPVTFAWDGLTIDV